MLYRKNITTAIPDVLHICDKLIALPRDGSDVLMLARALTKHLPQNGDVIGEVAFLDEAAGPNPLDQPLLADHLSAAFYKGKQDVETLRGELHDLAFAQQQALGCVQPESSELV